jgi:hypothetical protein
MNLARQCPRFDRCSVNRCPLAVGYPNQFVHPGDKRRRCTLEKGVRVRIAATSPGVLRMAGLTSAEHSAKLAFERKPVAVRLAMLAKGKASLAKLHTSHKLESYE